MVTSCFVDISSFILASFSDPSVAVTSIISTGGAPLLGLIHQYAFPEPPVHISIVPESSIETPSEDADLSALAAIDDEFAAVFDLLPTNNQNPIPATRRTITPMTTHFVA